MNSFKYFAILFILSFAFSCNGKEEKKQMGSFSNGNVKFNYKTIENLDTPDFDQWDLVRLSLRGFETIDDIKSFKLKRKDTNQSSYCRLRGIQVDSNSIYKVGIVVKQTDRSKLFGLRITDSYSDRIDVVFDLKKDSISDIAINGQKFKGNASITALNNGYYLCEIYALILTNQIEIIFGPAASNRTAEVWEASSSKYEELVFIPSSLSLIELVILEERDIFIDNIGE